MEKELESRKIKEKQQSQHCLEGYLEMVRKRVETNELRVKNHIFENEGNVLNESNSFSRIHTYKREPSVDLDSTENVSVEHSLEEIEQSQFFLEEEIPSLPVADEKIDLENLVQMEDDELSLGWDLFSPLDDHNYSKESRVRAQMQKLQNELTNLESNPTSRSISEIRKIAASLQRVKEIAGLNGDITEDIKPNYENDIENDVKNVFSANISSILGGCSSINSGEFQKNESKNIKSEIGIDVALFLDINKNTLSEMAAPDNDGANNAGISMDEGNELKLDRNLPKNNTRSLTPDANRNSTNSPTEPTIATNTNNKKNCSNKDYEEVSDAEECLEFLSQTCSEPLEYACKDGIATLEEDDSNQLKINLLETFAEDILKSCADVKKSNTPVELLYTEVFNKFKNIFYEKQRKEVSIQTENVGKFISKEKQLLINEKEKQRLMEPSSGESELSSDEYEKFADCLLSDIEDSDTDVREDESDYSDVEKKSAENMLKNDTDSSNIQHDKHEKNLLENEMISETGSLKLESTCDAQSDSKIMSEILANDKKLKMKPMVLLKKLTDEDLEDYYDDLREKEIDKLLDFKSTHKKINRVIERTNHDKINSALKCSKPANLLDILKDGEKTVDSDESNSEEENDIITEKQYLAQCNENMRKQLLSSSTSDSESESESSIPDEDAESKSETSIDSNDSPLMEKFLMEMYGPPDNKETGNQTISSQSKNTEKEIDLENVKEKNDTAKEIKNAEETMNPNITTTKVTECNEDGVSLGSSTASEIENKPSIEIQTNKTNSVLCESIVKPKNIDIKSPRVHALNESGEDSNKENSDDSDCEIYPEPLINKPRKEKSLDTLQAEFNKRRSNPKSVSDSISVSSGSESEVEEKDEDAQKRVLKPMLRQDQLAGETRIAQKEENDRIRRLEKKQDLMAKVLKEKSKDASTKKLILDYISETKTFIEVNPNIVSQLKSHQIDGVKFMYDACYGSVDNLRKHPGSGCILAHCMGLGKTLQLIALLNTVISYKELRTSKILVLCPKSTVMNWKDEIQRWLAPVNTTQLKIFSFPDQCDIQEKLRLLEDWFQSGESGSKKPGVFLMGYEAFRTLIFYHEYKKQKNFLPAKKLDFIKKKIKEMLLQPGADLVICDEGHIIKNRKSAISTAVSEIKTLRRIILTGTPIQNNLKEYYSMVNFIKPSFLGTEREFANLYSNPIRCGQHKDSSKKEIKIMKQRSFVLHKKLSKFVQRREAALLKSFLPEKHEYVLFSPMTDVQNRAYEFFLNSIALRTTSKGKNLLTDYTCLRKIWTHPKVLENAWQNATNTKNKKEVKKTPTRINSDDDEPDDVYDSQEGVLSVTNDWWRPLITDEDLISLFPSNKLRIMFEILRMCAENGEKCLIFSAFVAVLNVVEYFMKQIHLKDFGNQSPNIKDLGFDKFKGPWVEGKDYYRLDGRTPKSMRHEMVKSFNNPKNERVRCFLISSKAGGQGINLIGANRVIIIDTSWNPSNDQQNIFRIFRLGQKKKCFVYRLLAMGTMEEKVYSRSVTKQAMSFRVVDEQQIDRHYRMEELTELYTLTTPNHAERPVPTIPKDNVLASLLHNFPRMVYKYHEHDSLLENKLEQELSEQEKEDAWRAYEHDLKCNQGVPDIQISMASTGLFPQPGPGNFLPPYAAGFPGRNFPMGFHPSMAGGLPTPYSPYDYQRSAIMDMYNMYQNYAVPNPSLMSMINNSNPINGAHPFSNTSNHLASTSGILNSNLISQNVNKLSALNVINSFNSLVSTPQTTSNTPLTSHTSLYTSPNNPTSYRPPTLPTGDNLRRMLEINSPCTSLELGTQQNINKTNPRLAQFIPSLETGSGSGITSTNMLIDHMRSYIENSDNIVSLNSSIPAHITPTTSVIATTVAASSQNAPTSIQSSLNRALNMGIVYPEKTTNERSIAKTTMAVITPSPAKSIESAIQNRNISVRSVNSINNATSTFLTPATTTIANSLTKNSSIFQPQDRSVTIVSTSSVLPQVSLTQSKTAPIPNNVKAIGAINQIQVSPLTTLKKVSQKKTINIEQSSPKRSVPSSISVVPSMRQTNKKNFSNISKPVVSVSSIVSKIVDKNIQRKSLLTSNYGNTVISNMSTIATSPTTNINKLGNIRSKLITKNIPPNTTPISNSIKQPSQTFTNSSSNIQNVRFQAPNNKYQITKSNQVPTPVSSVQSGSKVKPVAIPNTTANKNIVISNVIEKQKNSSVRTNAALTTLSTRNNLSIRPVTSKLNNTGNTGITISPGSNSTLIRKPTTSNVIINNSVNASIKGMESRKRPSSNISFILPENSPISVRPVKRAKMAPTTENVTVQSVRPQNTAPSTLPGLNTIQLIPPEKLSEVVEID